uniref:RAD51-associated protein 1 n=1 Tax=Xenopus tropicalis TaxID=8364 RepID=A0A6I8SI59_XENTR
CPPLKNCSLKTICVFLKFDFTSSQKISFRNKKAVDYSQFGDLDNDDEDFAFSSAPPSKKARVECKKEKKEKLAKKSNKEESLSQQTPSGNRLSLDEKLYQRDLEVALALSAQKTTAIVESREENGVATFIDDETSERADTLFSNCSVDSSALGLDEITSGKEDQLRGQNRRQAASKAISEQRKLLADDSGDDEEDEFKPDVAYDESESDEDYSGEDEEFELKNTKKSKAKESKGSKQKAKSEKKEKSLPKPKVNAKLISSPVPTKAKSLPAKKTPAPSPAPVKQAIHHSPSVGMKKPTWSPPAPVGSVKHSLEGVTVKSPSQGLRLGLSRLARIKPLHPAIVKH